MTRNSAIARQLMKASQRQFMRSPTLIVREDTLVENENFDGNEVLCLSYAGHEGYVPTIRRDDEASKKVLDALEKLVNETHAVSICGKRSMETWVLKEDTMTEMTITDDNVRYFVDGKELLHEVKTPYTEEFYNGAHEVSTCLNWQFAQLCYEFPKSMLKVAQNSQVFTDASELRKAVRTAS